MSSMPVMVRPVFYADAVEDSMNYDAALKHTWNPSMTRSGGSKTDTASEQ